MASDVTTTTNATTGNVTATEQSGQNQTNTVNVNTTADTASQTGNVSVTLNSGANDTVNVAAKGAVTVTVGNGAADTVNVNNLATDTANVTVTMGTGSGDQVNINDASLRNTVVTKDVAGNAVGDTVNITDSNASAVNIVTMGNANGDTAIINSAGLTNTVTMGSGDNDSVTIVDSNALSRNTVNMGAGNNDAIKIISDGTTSITAAEAVISGVEVSLGAGNNQTIDILGNGTTSMDLGNTNNTITTGTGKTTIYADDGNNVIRTDMAILNAGTALAAFSSMQNLVGDLAKYISLGAGNNSVFVGSGNSTILAGDGSNTVMAGDGNNTVKLGNGNDSVTVGNGTAYSTTNTTTNVTVNYAGGDTIIAGDGNDTVVAGNGNNNIRLGNGNDSVTVGDGKAYTSVNNTTNVTTNYAGYNTIIAGNGNDTVVAGNGNNNVQLGNGVDSVTLGNGNNTVRLGNGTSLTNVGTNKDTVVAGNGNNNIIIGDGDNSSITVGNGNNVIGVGYGNNDVVIAGNGNNRVYASDKDYVVGETDSDHDAGGIGKTQTITMGNGNDVVDAGMSNLNITLGHGTDTIWTSDGNSTIMVDQGAAAPGQLDGNKYISVGNGNNTIVAGNGNNTVIAGDGIKPYPLFKDNITLGNGNNRVLVRDGLDSSASMDTIITVGQGNNTITVGDGNDKIMAGDGTAYSVTNATTNVTTNYAGGNTVVGGNGNDVVIAGNGNNNIRLGNGNDTVTVGDGKAYSSVNNTTNVTTNYAGGNTITVGDGNDVITAGNGNNSINVGNGNDNIHVGNGANRISFGDGNDVIVAGDGNNTISSKDSANGEGVPEIPTTAGTVSITVGNGNNSIWGGQDRTVNVMAGNGANTITVGNGVDSVTVGDGNNRITYGNGGDIIHAGDGNNVISTIFDGDYAANLGLGDSDDKYASHVQDQIFVGQGNNTIVAGAMDTTIMAGNGNNTITGRDLSLADLVLHNLPVLNNSASHLSITVGMGHNTIRLGGGDDTVMASDTFATSAGNVRANTITGGNGNDTVTVGDGNNSISLGSGNDMITAGNGNNAIVGKSVAGTVDTIVVGNGNNSITTGAGDDIITAGNGNNVINAGAGNDIITVGNGNNTITGGTGSDMVTVGKGTNTVTMGDGVDQVTLNISAADLNPPAVHETLNGGGGIDTLVIHVSEADSHNVAYMNALNALAADIAYRVAHNTTGSWATNAALGIKYVNFENVIIDIAAPANHAPTDISLSNNSVDENSPAGTLVANLSASDPDAGDTFTFSLVNASSQFQIVGNQLQVKAGAVIDYETTQQIPLSIQVMDNHGATFVKNININVNNLNDNAPELHVIGAVTNVDENTVNVVMAAFSPITDADGNLNPLSYILSGADAAKFQMQGDNLVLISPADYETQHSLDVTVTATDGLNNSLLPQNFTFAVNNLNDNAPVLHLVSQQANVDENAANVVMAAFSPITDADGALNPLIYVLSGADAAKFQMQGDNLVLINAADYEAQHSLNVTVTATDGLNNSLLPQNFTFAVNNLNDNAPVLHFVSAVTSVDENTANVVMAAFSPITDADGNLNPLSYILSGADAAKFQMQGDNLVLISPADYETQHSLTVIVTATDGNNISIPSQGFNFAVNDVNEAPTALNLSATNVDENVAAGTVIGNLSDVDPDTNPAFNGAAYSLVAGYGDNSAFSVVGNQLVINVSPDFETKSSYDIKVHVDDGSATGLDQTFTINVNDLNENLPPLFTNNTDYVQFNPFGTVSFFAGIPFATPLSTQNLSSYDPSTWYNALDGNDIVKGLENLIGLDTHAFHGGAGNDSLEISSGLSNQTMQGLYGDAGNDTLSIISYSDPFHPRYSLSDNSVVTMVGGAGDDTLNLGQTDYGVNGSTSHFVLGYDMSMNNGNDTVNRFNTAPLGQMSYDVLSFSNISYAALLADTTFTADLNGNLMLNLFSDAAHLNAIGSIDFTDILYDARYELVSATSDPTQVHLEIALPPLFTNGNDNVVFNPDGTVSVYADSALTQLLSTQSLSYYDPSSLNNTLAGNDTVEGLQYLAGLDTHNFQLGSGVDQAIMSVSGFGIYTALINQTIQGIYAGNGGDTISISANSESVNASIPNGVAIPYGLYNSSVNLVGGQGNDSISISATATTTSSEPIGGLLTTAYGLYNSSAILDGGAGNDNLSISANNMNLDGSNTASYALYNSTATLDGGTGDDLLSVTASATDVNPTALPTHTVVDALANNSVAEIYGGQGNDTIALGNTDNTSHFTLDYNMAENSGADMVTGFMANNAGYQLNFSNVPGAGDLATVLADTSFSDDGSGHLMLSLWSDASHTTSIGTLDFMDVNFDPNALYLLSGALGAEIIVVDHAPILANQIADQVVNVGQALNFSVANTFSDGDVGDVLTYSATLANGDPLPSWLAFDPNTQTFSGTDATAETLSVKVVATDAYGLSASDTFNITVNALPPLFTNNADNVVFSPVNFGVYQASNDGGTTFHDLSYFDPSTLYNTFAGNDTVLVQDSLGGIQGFSIVTGDGNDVISLLESNGYLQNNTITLGAGAFDSVDLEAGGFNPNLGLGFLHGNTINFAADGQAGHTYSLNVAITAQGVSGNVISLQGMGNDVVNLLNVGASQSTIAFASAQDGSHDGMSGFVFGSGGTTMDLSQLFSSVPTMMSQDDGNGHLLAQFSDGFHTLSIDFTDVNFDPNADYALIGNSLSSEHILPSLFTNNADNVVFNGDGTVSVYADSALTQLLGTHSLSYYAQSTWYNTFGGNDTVYVANGPNSADISGYNFTMGDGNDTIDFITAGNAGIQSNVITLGAGAADSVDLKAADTVSRNTICFAADGQAGHTYSLNVAITAGLVFGNTITLAGSGNDVVNLLNAGASLSTIAFASAQDGAHDSMSGFALGSLSVATAGTILDLSNLFSSVPTMMSQDDGSGHLLARFSDGSHNLSIDFTDISFNPTLDYFLSGASLSAQNILAAPPLFTNGNDTVDFATVNTANYDPNSLYNTLAGNDTVNNLQDLTGLDTHTFVLGDLVGQTDNVNMGPLSQQNIMGIQGGAGTDNITISDSVNDQISSSVVAKTIFDSSVALDGGAGNDALNISAMASGSNSVTAYALNNNFGIIDYYVVTLDGGDGNDALSISATASSSGSANSTSATAYALSGYDLAMDGGAGDDTLSISATTSTPIDTHSETSYALFNSMVTMDGGDGNDALNISAAALGDLNSTAYALNVSTVTLDGGTGDDTLSISATASNASTTANSVFDGARAYAVLASTVTMDGGDGNDALSISATASGASSAAIAVFFSTATLDGGAGNDIVTVTATDTDVTSVTYALLSSTVTLDGGDGNDTLSISATSSGTGSVALALYNSTATLNGGAGNDILAVTATGTNTDIASFALYRNSVAEIYGGTGNDTIILGNTDNGVVYTGPNPVSTSHFSLDYNMAENSGADVVTGFMLNNAGYQLNFLNVPGAGDIVALLADTSFSNDGSGHLMLNLWSDASHTISIGTVDFTDISFDPTLDYFLSGASLSAQNILSAPPLFTNGNDTVDFATVNTANYAPNSLYNTLAGNDTVNNLQDLTGLDTHDFHLGNGVNQVNMSVVGTGVPNVICNQVIQGIYDGNGGDTINISSDFSGGFNSSGDGSGTLYQSTITLHAGSGGDTFNITARSPYYSTCAIFLSTANLLGGTGDDTMTISANGYGGNSEFNTALFHSTVLMDGGAGNDIMTISASGGLFNFGIEGNSIATMIGGAGNDTMNLGAADGTSHYVVQYNNENGGTDTVNGFNVGSDVLLFKGLLDAGNSNVLDLAHLDTISTMVNDGSGHAELKITAGGAAGTNVIFTNVAFDGNTAIEHYINSANIQFA